MPVSVAGGRRFGLLSVLLCCLSLLFAFAPEADAAETATDAGISASSKPHPIYACVTVKFGTLNRSSKRGRCRRGETKISWNAKGRRGKKGPRGQQGPAGARGPQGAKGSAGARGPSGAQGPPGTAGATGDQGVNGNTGATGAQGATGNQGVNGNTGATGSAGTAGTTGSTGPTGQSGVTGITGATGEQGSPDTPQQVLDKLLTVDGPGSGLDADLLDGLHATGFWQLGGNTSTTPATNFLGTTDDQPLNFRVNNARAFRLEPVLNGTAAAPNVIGGSPDNTVTAGAFSATIGGGGRNNQADPGSANRVGGAGGTVAGGLGNAAQAAGSTVGGGASNTASGILSTISGGSTNLASGLYSSASGGAANIASGASSKVGGGRENIASGLNSGVGSGRLNVASGTESTVSGGSLNIASNNSSSVGGGNNNVASGVWSSVSGGVNNTASGARSSIAAGSNNVVAASGGFAAGNNANVLATHPGAMLFSDSFGGAFDSVASDEFGVRASGGFRFRTSSGLSTGCDLPAGSGVFTCTSDRNTKEDFEPIDGDDVLEQLADIPITSWTFKTDASGARHAGPMAQDFYAAFGFGSDDKSISTTDVDGVALAAIKTLAEKSEAQDEKIADLEARLAELED